MTLDERIRSTLEEAASAVPYVSATAPDEIRRRGRRRRMRRRAAWSVASVAVVLGLLAVTIPYDPNPIDPATTHDVETVEIADLAVAVTDAEPVSTDPDVWLGLRGPSPEFDTSALGTDLSLTPGKPSPDDLGDRVVRAVYLGELDGEPFYIYSSNAPSIWDQIFEVIGGNFSGDVLGTSLNCCSGGDMDHEEGLPGFSQSRTTGQPDVIIAEWLGLSLDVSVVAYRLDGDYIGWQTPVGGVATIRLDESPNEILLVALDESGRELDRIGPWAIAPLPDIPVATNGEETTRTTTPGEAWAPLTSEGSEIQPEDIPTEGLRDEISPQPGDRLFLVPVEGGEIIVRVRAGVPHAYAASCEVLDRVDLPFGWEETCLD